MKLLLATMILGLTVPTWAKVHTHIQKVDDDIIKEVVITEGEVEVLSFDDAEMLGMEAKDPVEDLIGSIGKAIATGEIDPSQIVNVAQKAWVVIRENEPVLNAKGKSANALPQGLTRWEMLDSWQAPRAQTYRVQYKNAFGATVVDLSYRLVYSYGGTAAGVGKYIANASIQYNRVEVLWGYIFNAHVEVPQTLNMGTSKNPVAGMEMTLNWNIRTRPVSIKKGKYSTSFFISGNGAPVKILN